MIAEWLINPNSHNLGLKNLAWVRQDIRMTNIEELIGKGKNQISMADVPHRHGYRLRWRRCCHSIELDAGAARASCENIMEVPCSRIWKCRWFQCWPIWRWQGWP